MQTSRGLLLPLLITSPGYFYVSTSSVSFELAMLLDFDLTIGLLGPVLKDGLLPPCAHRKPAPRCGPEKVGAV